MSEKKKQERLNRLQREMMEHYGENAVLSVDPDPAHSVRCHNGTFVPKVHGTVCAFRGIPFALPPVGPRRWKTPKAVGESDEIREAYYNAKTPIQTLLHSERASLYPQGEDCLYLNVWLNTACTRTNKPVMVFIHGGSYGWGGTADPLYDGFNFVSYHEDVILITIAYRVGLLGFIDFRALSDGADYPDAPNLGLLDQIEALRYIKRNAAAFGGDPDNITIFGESAGGGSISLLPMIDEAKGLFRRVIAESGSVALTFSIDECQPLTQKLVQNAGVSTVKELMELSEERLMELNVPLNDFNNFPERDGGLIPLDPYEPYLDGRTKDIPILSGTNANETNYWIGELGGMLPYTLGTPIKVRNDLRKLSEEDKNRTKEYFKNRKGTLIWRATEFYNEMMFRLPAIRQMEGHSRNGGASYFYYWKEPSRKVLFRCCHAVELAYVFLNVDDTVYTGKKADETFARQVSTMWVNFARNGDPSIETLRWERYDEAHRKTMVLAAGKSHTEEDILKKQREVLSPLLRYWICPSYADIDYSMSFGVKIQLLLFALTETVIAYVYAFFHPIR